MKFMGNAILSKDKFRFCTITERKRNKIHQEKWILCMSNNKTQNENAMPAGKEH